VWSFWQFREQWTKTPLRGNRHTLAPSRRCPQRSAFWLRENPGPGDGEVYELPTTRPEVVFRMGTGPPMQKLIPWSLLTLFTLAVVLLATVARAQDRLHRQLTFSSPVTEAQCRQFPSEHFEIGPSGDRWNSKDLLSVRCGSTAHGPLAENFPDIGGRFVLTLTFTINTNGASAPRGVLGEVYSFRWGRSINSPSPSFFRGQFTHNLDLCSRLTHVLNSKVLKWMPDASARVHQPPTLSSSCNPDDLWVTSMEIRVTADFQ